VPEGDTVFRIAVVLRDALVGHRVARFSSPLPALRDADLEGRVVASVEARGKNLLVGFDDERTLHTHLRMSGSWVLHGLGRRLPNALVALETDDRLAALVARRGAGAPPVARLLSRDALRRDRALRSLGPDVLSPAFDADEAARRLRASVHPTIAEALLDQRDVAGIGNEYKSELLFLCGLDPRTPPGAVETSRLVELLARARELMTKNVARSGRRFAVAGRATRFSPGPSRWVYGRAGRPCLRCGAPIRSVHQGLDRRRTFFCPRCQK
jgi:endonuclease-8